MMPDYLQQFRNISMMIVGGTQNEIF